MNFNSIVWSPLVCNQAESQELGADARLRAKYERDMLQMSRGNPGVSERMLAADSNEPQTVADLFRQHGWPK